MAACTLQLFSLCFIGFASQSFRQNTARALCFDIVCSLLRQPTAGHGNKPSLFLIVLFDGPSGATAAAFFQPASWQQAVSRALFCFCFLVYLDSRIGQAPPWGLPAKTATGQPVRERPAVGKPTPCLVALLVPRLLAFLRRLQTKIPN